MKSATCQSNDDQQRPAPDGAPNCDGPNQLISQLAEAKMHLLILAHGTVQGSLERARELTDLKSCTTKAKQAALEIGSIPKPLVALLLVCEKAVEHFSKEVNP